MSHILKKYTLGLTALIFSLPLSAYAAITNLQTLIIAVEDILDAIVGILVTLAVFVIIWGIFKFIVNADDESARATGRSAILWGVIGVFFIISVWGLINIVVNTVDLDTDPISAPSISGGGGGGTISFTQCVADCQIDYPGLSPAECAMGC